MFKVIAMTKRKDFYESIAEYELPGIDFAFVDNIDDNVALWMIGLRQFDMSLETRGYTGLNNL